MTALKHLILPILTSSLLLVALPSHAETPKQKQSQNATNNPFSYQVNQQWETLSKQVIEYRKARNYAKAIESAKQAITVAEKSKGKNHPATALSYQALGLSYLGTGEYDKSNDAFIASSNIIKHLAKQPEYANYQNEIQRFISFDSYYLSANYLIKKDYQQALSYAKQSLSSQESLRKPNKYKISERLELLSAIYQGLKDKTNFEQTMTRLIALNEFRLGKSDRQYLAWTNALSVYYIQTGQVNKAIELQKSQINKLKKINKQPTQELAIAYQVLGLTYRGNKQYKESLTAFNKLIKIAEKLDGKNHLNTVSAYMNVAVTYLASKDFKQAKNYLNQAKSKVAKLEKSLKAKGTLDKAKQQEIDFFNQAIEHYMSIAEKK